MNTVFIINGPNLNLLGSREPEIYGYETLANIENKIRSHAFTYDFEIDFRQSNYEGELVTFIHEARKNSTAIIINPAAYTHTSVAILDALQAYDGLVIEVHLSNIHKREDFRKHSFVSQRADGIIAGLGSYGYTCAIDFIGESIKSANN